MSIKKSSFRLTLLATLLVSVGLGAYALGAPNAFALAVSGGSPAGWAWGGTPSTDGAYQGAGWIDLTGVTVPMTSGNLTGYAWTPYYGWLSFNTADLSGCPTGTCTAHYDSATKTITGWARFLALESTPGMNGWVSLSGSGYGIGTGGNYVWSGDLGWIDMSGMLAPCTNGAVNPPSCTIFPPTASLSANPTSIWVGDSSTLSWSSTNATSCTSTGGFSTGGTKSGSASVSPLTTSTYQITCTDAGGTSSPANATVTVLQPNVTLTATPTRIKSGGTVTIAWTSQYVTSCQVTKNGVAWASGKTGSQTDTLTAQATYVATCQSKVVAVTASQQVIVDIAPAFQNF